MISSEETPAGREHGNAASSQKPSVVQRQWDRFIAWWRTLSDWQRFVFGGASSIIVVWAAGKLLDYLYGQLPVWAQRWVPWAMVYTFLNTYILNLYVAILIVGLLLGGFGAKLFWLIRRYVFSQGGRGVLAIICGAAALSSILIYYNHWREPTLYRPPVFAMKDDSGSPRIFETKTPHEIESAFDDTTTAHAHKILKGELSKWIAITGLIVDVSDNDGGGLLMDLGAVGLTLNKRRAVKLYFRPSEFPKIENLQADDRIYAVCKMKSTSYYELIVDQCVVAPPK